MKENLGKEFGKFVKSDFKSINSDMYNHYMNNYTASATPYIIEERQLNVTQMDVFSRLMMDRIIWLSGQVEPNMASIIQAQLLFLDSVDNTRPISIYLSSPGGSVNSGLGIVDTMDYIKSDVATLNLGMAASMGSVILSSGTKGMRSSLVCSKTMIHQVSHGSQGEIQSTRISQMEAEKYNFLLFKRLSMNSNISFDEMLELASHDKWLNSDETLALNLIDEVVIQEGQESITERMVGFEDYYNKIVTKQLNNK